MGCGDWYSSSVDDWKNSAILNKVSLISGVAS
jgi:hypothetical protein